MLLVQPIKFLSRSISIPPCHAMLVWTGWKRGHGRDFLISFMIAPSAPSLLAGNRLMDMNGIHTRQKKCISLVNKKTKPVNYWGKILISNPFL